MDLTSQNVQNSSGTTSVASVACASDSSLHVSVLLLTMAESQSDCEITLGYCKIVCIGVVSNAQVYWNHSTYFIAKLPK